jgi:hypothetical protein
MMPVLAADDDSRFRTPGSRKTPNAAIPTQLQEQVPRGLAVEVVAGDDDSTTYRIGSELIVSGELLAAFDVEVDAPNDIASSPEEGIRIGVQRAGSPVLLFALLDGGSASVLTHLVLLARCALGLGTGFLSRNGRDRLRRNTSWSGAGSAPSCPEWCGRA